MAFLCPVLVLHLLEGTQHGLNADTVCTMWVSKVTGCIYLVRFDLAHEFLYNLDIIVAELALLYTTGLIERQVKEVGVSAVIETD